MSNLRYREFQNVGIPRNFYRYPIFQPSENGINPPLIPRVTSWNIRKYTNGVEIFMPVNTVIKNQIEFDKMIQIYGKYFNMDNYSTNNSNGVPYYNKLNSQNQKRVYSSLSQNRQFYNYLHGSKLFSKDYDYRRNRNEDFRMRFRNEDLEKMFQKRIEGLETCGQTHHNERLRGWMSNQYIHEREMMYRPNQTNLKTKINTLCKESKFNPNHSNYRPEISTCSLNIEEMLYEAIKDDSQIIDKQLFIQGILEILQQVPYEQQMNAIDNYLQNMNTNQKNKIQNILFENNTFHYVLTNYALPQGMQIGLYGYSTYLYTVMEKCKHIYNIMTFLDASKEIDPCNPYVEWTLHANALRMFCTLRKDCDIPLIFWMKHDINYKIIPRIYNKIEASFLGILNIPFYATRDDGRVLMQNYPLFLFQYDKKIVKNRIIQTRSNILILNKYKMRVELGTLWPNPSVTYDELKILYYLSNLPENSIDEKKCYLYYDENAPKYIMVSLKNNLHENPSYHLKQLIIQEIRNSKRATGLIAINKFNTSKKILEIKYNSL